MRKFFVTLCALAVTAALVWSLFGFQPRAVEPPSLQLSLIRVWVSGQDPAVWSWLRKAAKQYEKETGRRVYLRAGPAEDTGAFEFIHRYLTVSEIADYVSQAKFVVCPYTDATQSGVIQTALGLGTPVVASDVGNFRDVITDGDNGLLVPPSDSDALADAYGKLLSDSRLLADMRANIAEACQSEGGDWARIVQQYEAVYLSK